MALQSKRPDPAMLEKAITVIKREMEAGTYGAITITLEAGHVVRVKTEKNELFQPRRT